MSTDLLPPRAGHPRLGARILAREPTMWIRFKDQSGRWGEKQWLAIGEDELLRLRGLVGADFQRYVARVGGRDKAMLGFAPRSFASSVMSQQAEFAKRWSGFDLIVATYAAYMPMQIAGGSWESGPEKKWKKLEGVYGP